MTYILYGPVVPMLDNGINYHTRELFLFDFHSNIRLCFIIFLSIPLLNS